MPSRTLIDLTGKQYGYVTVLGRHKENTPGGKPMWDCVCECGNKIIIAGMQLRRGVINRSCGCRAIRGADHPAWRGVGEISSSWWYRHVIYATRYKGQHRRRGITLSLTISEAWKLFTDQEGLCALSGVPIVVSDDKLLNTASLDRINSAGHYELSNVQWVHRDVNFMKQSFPQDYFLKMCRLIAAHAA